MFITFISHYNIRALTSLFSCRKYSKLATFVYSLIGIIFGNLFRIFGNNKIFMEYIFNTMGYTDLIWKPNAFVLFSVDVLK